jgi:hypothetical protein
VLIAAKDESSALILALQNSALNLEPKIPQNQKLLPKKKEEKEKNLQNPNFCHQIESREFLPRSTDDTKRASEKNPQQYKQESGDG